MQLDIKLRQFTQEELDSVPRKIKNWKAPRLDEIPQKNGRPGNSMMVWFLGFYGISTFVGYLTPNTFLCK